MFDRLGTPPTSACAGFAQAGAPLDVFWVATRYGCSVGVQFD